MPVLGRDGRLEGALLKVDERIAIMKENELFFYEHNRQEQFAQLTQYCCLQIACSIQSCLQIILNGLLQDEIKLARIKETLEGINSDWAQIYAQHEGREAIGSILSNRNRIAHCQTSDITIGSLNGWWEKSREFLLELHELVASRIS